MGCFEGVGKSDATSTDVMKTVLECYMQMDQPHAVSMIAQGMANQEGEDFITAFKMEAAWHLSHWKALESYSHGDSDAQRSWKEHLAESLLAVYKSDAKRVFNELDKMQAPEIQAIAAAAMEQGSYLRSYRHVVRLQIINEIERVTEEFLLKPEHEWPNEDGLEEMFAVWKARTDFCQFSLDSLEPILKVRKSLLKI